MCTGLKCKEFALLHFLVGGHLLQNEEAFLCIRFVNPFAAEVTFVQCTKKQIILKIIRTKSYGYSYESSHWVLSDEYPFARVSVIFPVFLQNFVLAKSATSSIRVNGLLVAWKKKCSVHKGFVSVLFLWTGSCWRVASDLGDGFARCSSLLQHLQLASHNFVAILQKKWRKIEIQIAGEWKEAQCKQYAGVFNLAMFTLPRNHPWWAWPLNPFMLTSSLRNCRLDIWYFWQ